MNENPFLQYVKILQSARALAALSHPVDAHGGFSKPSDEENGVVLLFSPHPDDESIIGALALRLLRAHYRVLNVAVTLGSDASQRERRRQELAKACEYLGFDLALAGENGLDNVTPKTRSEDEKQWAEKVAVIVRTLQEHQPTVIFYPHSSDYNTTHIGTYHLITDALVAMSKASADFSCHCFQTEYWHPMNGRDRENSPNLLVESPSEDVAEMMNAIALHAGEVVRNPYHLTLPHWMADNVRRGAEIVGAQGGAAPKFDWGTIYRHGLWVGGHFSPLKPRLLRVADDPYLLF